MNRWRFSQAISYRIAINVLVLLMCARFATLMGPTNATTPTIDSIFQKSSVLFHVWCSFFMTCMIFFQKLYIAQRAACVPCWWMRFHLQLLLGRKRRDCEMRRNLYATRKIPAAASYWWKARPSREDNNSPKPWKALRLTYMLLVWFGGWQFYSWQDTVSSMMTSHFRICGYTKVDIRRNSFTTSKPGCSRRKWKD